MPGRLDALADRLASLVARRAGAILAATLLIAAACALLAAWMPERGASAGASELVVVVRCDPQDGASYRRATACVSDLAASLSSDPEIGPVQWGAPLEPGSLDWARLAPLPRYRAWIREAVEAQSVLEADSPGELMKELNDRLEQPAGPQRGDLDLLARLVWGVYDGWTDPSRVHEAFDGLMPGSATATRRYLESPDGRLLFVVAPRGSAPAARRAIEAVRARHPGVESALAEADGALAGAPAGAGPLALAAAVALVSVILVASLRGVVVPLLVLAALSVGAAWSLAFSGATVLPVAAGLGLGLQCGVMLAVTFDRAQRDSPVGPGHAEAALRPALRLSVPAIVAAAVGAAAGFAVAALAGGEGLARAGAAACAASVLGAAAVLAVVPAGLRLLGDGNPRVRVVTVAALALAAAGLARLAYIGGPPAGAGAAIPFAESVAGSLDEARVRADRFLSMETVLGVGAIGVPICEREPEKIELVREARRALGPSMTRAIEGPDPPLSKLSATMLATQLKRLGQILDAAEAKAESDRDAIGGLRQAVREMQEQMRPAPASERLTRMIPVDRAYHAMRRRLAVHLDGLLDESHFQVPAEPVESGVRLRVYPRPEEGARLGDPVTPEALRRFVRDLKSVDPAIAGPAVAAAGLGRTGWAACAAAIAAGFVVVLAGVRRLPDAAVAMVPAVLGAAAGLAMARLCGASGPAGVLALPLVAGSALAAGAHVALRARTAPDARPPGLAGGTGAAVGVAGLCVTAASAAVAVAGSGSTASAGAVVVVGAGVATLACLTALPAWLGRRG